MSPKSRLTKATLATAIIASTLGGFAWWRNLDQRPALTLITPPGPASALEALRSGNVRFVHSARVLSVDTSHDADFRRQTAKGQHPFAVMLCCADSRVCPEFIFDQAAGSIFEVRNAGNVVDEDVLASFEYAVEHLHVPLMLVMGHKGCGAIEAVCRAGDEPLHDHLRELQRHMTGIHRQVMESHGELTAELLVQLSKENARQQAMALVRDSHILKDAVEKGHSRLMCGLYDMETGTVSFFDPQSTNNPGGSDAGGRPRADAN